MNSLFARMIRWQRSAFGPADRRQGTIDHMEKELAELKLNPDDPEEWVDLGFMVIHGLWQTLKVKYPHMEPSDLAETVAGAFAAKLHKNSQRQWPDWDQQSPDKAVEHIRSTEEQERKRLEAIRATQNP